MGRNELAALIALRGGSFVSTDLCRRIAATLPDTERALKQLARRGFVTRDGNLAMITEKGAARIDKYAMR